MYCIYTIRIDNSLFESAVFDLTVEELYSWIKSLFWFFPSTLIVPWNHLKTVIYYPVTVECKNRKNYQVKFQFKSHLEFCFKIKMNELVVLFRFRSCLKVSENILNLPKAIKTINKNDKICFFMIQSIFVQFFF